MSLPIQTLRSSVLSLAVYTVALILFATDSVRSQDFSKSIKESATVCVDATISGDYKTLLEYTYPPLVSLLDSLAGGPGKGGQLIEQQMKALQTEGIYIDSGFIGEPTPSVKAGSELHAVIPISMYMSAEKLHFKQESYMIGVSSDGGKSWTFVNGSPNDDEMIAHLFPHWNSALELPEKKGPEILSMDEDTERPK